MSFVMSPDYDFKCVQCGLFVVSSYEVGYAPDKAVLWCPSCEDRSDHVRQFSFGIPRGASDEGLRKAL